MLETLLEAFGVEVSFTELAVGCDHYKDALAVNVYQDLAK